MEQFTQLVSTASDFLWNNILLFLLCGTGIYFTIRLGFVQIFKFGSGMRGMFSEFSLHGKAAGKDGMSSFQALTTAVAAQVGTGNITGCATALAGGGPGAIFWMWMSAFFGMATIYAEAILAQTFKTTVDGQVTGGPAYYIRAAFKGRFGKFLAGFFSVAIVLALGFMGNMVQSNSISDAFHNAFGVNKLAVGVVVAIIAAFIFLGGVKRLASVTEKLVPFMAVFYIVGCLIILVMRWQLIPNAFAQIFVLAFEPQAIAGGIAGVTVREAMRYGVARGLFSNEAGMGSTPHAHALAKVEHPQDQGVIAMIGVFFDTFVILTLTALVVITSGLIPTGAALTEGSRATRLSPEELEALLKQAVAWCAANGMEIDFTSPGWLPAETLLGLGLPMAPTCGACLSNMAVAPDGTVVPCQSWLTGEGLGNLLTDDWKAIWHSPRCAAIRAESAKLEHICQLREKEGAR